MPILLSNFYPSAGIPGPGEVTLANVVFTSGNQNISGIKNFDSRPTVRGTGVLLQGEAAGGSVTLPSNILFTTGNQIVSGEKTFVDKINIRNENFNQEVGRFPSFSFAGGSPKFWSGWKPNTWYIELEPSSFITVISTGNGAEIFADWYATTGVPMPTTGPIVPNAVKFNLLAKGTNLPVNGVLTGQFSAVSPGFNYTGTGFLPPNTRYLHFLNPIQGGGNMFLRVIGKTPVEQYDITIQNDRLFINNSGVLFQGEAASAVTLPSDILFTSGTQTITGPKNFTARPTFNGDNLITIGDVNIEGALASFSAFNGNRQIRQIPVLNTNYGGTTISGFLENMFFPYTVTTLSITPFTTKIYGVNSVAGDSFAGTINPTDDTITGISYRNNVGNLFGPVTRTTVGAYNTFPTNIPFGTTYTASTLDIFFTRIFGTRSGTPFTADSSSIRLRFEPPWYWGTSNNPNVTDPTTLNRVDPVNNSSFYSYTFGSRPGTITQSFTPTGQYVYLFYPSFTRDNITDWGTVTEIRDMNTNLIYTLNTFQTGEINLNLSTQSNMRYRRYRSLDLITPIDPLNPASYQFRFTLGG